jgi:hypothetical protein
VDDTDAPEPSVFRLSFKTDDPRLRRLAECYWASYLGPDGKVRFKYGVVEDVAPRFGLRATAASVTGPVMDAATALHGRCPRCRREMEYAHRTAFTQRHNDFARGKPCGECQEQERREQTLARRRAIRRRYWTQPIALDTSKMTLRDAVYSLAVLRASSFKGARRLTSSRSFRPRLSPSSTFDRDILIHLYGRKIISIDPNSDEKSFDFNAKGEAEWYYPVNVCWRWRDLDPSQFAKNVEALIGRKAFPADWIADVTSLSQDIARYECVGLFQSLDNHHQLRWELPKDWESVLARGLESCSVSQIQPVIIAALKATCDEIEWTRRTPQLCGKTWVAKVKTQLDQIRREQKPGGLTARYSDCPRSAISVVFYDTLLHAGDDGFTKLPELFPKAVDGRANSSGSSFSVDEHDAVDQVF